MTRSYEVPNIARSRAIEETHRARRNIFVAIVVLITVFEASLVFAISRPNEPLPPIAFARPLSGINEHPLCPDDTVSATFDLTVQGPAVLSIDMSVLRPTDNSMTLAYRERRAIIPGPVNFQVNQRWRIPEEFIDAVTGERHFWKPGYYELALAMSTESRDTIPTIITFPFLIGECQ